MKGGNIMRKITRTKVMSILLTFAMIFSLFIGNSSMKIYAADFQDPNVRNICLYNSGCLKSMEMTIAPIGTYGAATGRIGVHSAQSKFGWNNRYSYDGSSWPATIENDNFICFADGAEFVWTSGTHNVTVQFDDGQVSLKQSGSIYVHLWTRSTAYGVYPDALICVLKTEDGKLLDSSGNSLADASDAGEKETYTIDAVASPSNGGTISGTGNYDEGDSVTLTATPNDGFKFVGWKNVETTLSNNANYSFTASENVSLTAVFEQDVKDTTPINISVNYAKIAQNLNITSGIKEGDDIPSLRNISGSELENCDIITCASELSDLETVIYGWCEKVGEGEGINNCGYQPAMGQFSCSGSYSIYIGLYGVYDDKDRINVLGANLIDWDEDDDYLIYNIPIGDIDDINDKIEAGGSGSETNTDAEVVEAAKTIASNVLKGFTASNSTTGQNLASVVNAELTKNNNTATVSVKNFTKVDATTQTSGSIKCTLTFTSGSEC